MFSSFEQIGARDYEAAVKYLLEETYRIQGLAEARHDLHVEVALQLSVFCPCSAICST